MKKPYTAPTLTVIPAGFFVPGQTVHIHVRGRIRADMPMPFPSTAYAHVPFIERSCAPHDAECAGCVERVRFFRAPKARLSLTRRRRTRQTYSVGAIVARMRSSHTITAWFGWD